MTREQTLDGVETIIGKSDIVDKPAEAQAGEVASPATTSAPVAQAAVALAPNNEETQ